MKVNRLLNEYYSTILACKSSSHDKYINMNRSLRLIEGTDHVICTLAYLEALDLYPFKAGTDQEKWHHKGYRSGDLYLGFPHMTTELVQIRKTKIIQGTDQISNWSVTGFWIENKGTDQISKQGYRSRKPRKIKGTFSLIEKQGYRSTHKTGVQIKCQTRGTDQGNPGKTRVQINSPGGQNQGTDQLFWTWNCLLALPNIELC